MLLIFQILSFLFAVVWLWSCILHARTLRALKIALNSNAKLHEVIETAKLAEVLLEQNKVTQATTKELLECTKTLHDRVGDYNHRLNELNTITRIKVQRTVDAAVKECDKREH